MNMDNTLVLPGFKLGGEIFPRVRMYVSHYIYGHVWPDNQYQSHSHCVRTLTIIIPDILCSGNRFRK